MELNEAIAHCEEKAKELRKEADYYRKPSLTFDQEGKEKDCLECAHEHEQLADWLRELKERRENDEKEYSRGYADGCVAGYAEGKESFPPQGKWEEPFYHNDKTYHKCNHCHVSSQLILIDNYCPNCGARMTKEEKP